MKAGKHLYIWILITGLFGLSVSAFGILKRAIPLANYNILVNVSPSDSLKVDSIQLSMDKYNRLTSYLDANIDSKNNNEREIDELNRHIQKIHSRVSNYKAENERINNLAARDTLKNLNDSLIQLNAQLERKKNTSIYELQKEIEKDSVQLALRLKESKKYIEQKNKIEKEFRECGAEIKQFISKQKGAFRIKFKNESYYVFIADLDVCEITFHWRNKGNGPNSIRTVLNSPELQKRDVFMVTNAGMYTPDFKPKGLYVENRKEIIPLDVSTPKTDANFYLQPNGVFYVDTNNHAHIDNTLEYKQEHDSTSRNVKYATQSGPMLVINREINKVFTPNSANMKIRSGVGIISDKKIVFAISIGEVSFYDFALLFRDICNTRNALFLDGAISSMYLQDINPNANNGQFGPMISISKK